MIPFGDKLSDYFRKYQSAQSHLDAILHALHDGQDELGKDNAALNLEKQHLWEAMGRLNQYVYVAERLDARLAAKIAELEATDPDRAKALREDVLFYVRQKHQDLLTQLAVSIQSYLAIDIVIKNNIELIKGVDRATTTTVSALRTAVIVAQALANQKLVLDQITALNTTTSGMIERTSEMLRDNSVQIQQQAASATVGLPQLQAAFANIYATMDAIDTFKVEALDNMAATIGTLETEVAKSQTYLDRVAAAGRPRRAAGRSTSAAPRALGAGRPLGDSEHMSGGFLGRLLGRGSTPGRRDRFVVPARADQRGPAGRPGPGRGDGRRRARCPRRSRPASAASTGSSRHHPPARQPRRRQPAGLLRDGHGDRLPAGGDRRLPAPAPAVGRQPPGRPAARPR